MKITKFTNFKNISRPHFVIGIAIVFGLFLLGNQVKRGLNGISNNQRTVSVRGLSAREVTADVVTWPIVSKEVGNDLPSLYNKLEETNKIILSFLKDNGIEEDEISFSAPEVVDQQADRYGSDDVKFRYNITNVVVVTSSKVEKVNDLVKRQVELLKSGVAIVTNSYQYQINYEYTNLNAIKPEMIADATRNAREAANKFAEDSGSKLGKIMTASQGTFTIEDRDPYTPYIKYVRVVSSIVYCLND
ncbi:MAG: SIMPL domain-containing protein [Muribaculaceae bacterium]|nr:SIMPL domain-containing protein [Muribaculaceae bacterium]